MKTYITPEQAVSVLPDGDSVHTFYNPGFGLIGADWSRPDIVDKLKDSEIIELTGPSARRMGHAGKAVEGVRAMSRSGGYKCYNMRCHSCVGRTLCAEPGDVALSCVDRIVSNKTNADRIRSMSDEELAEIFTRHAYEAHGKWYGPDQKTCWSESRYALDAWTDWLRRPAEED